MKRLLSIELQKIWMNRSSKILTISYFVLLTAIALVASIKLDIGNFKFHLADMGIFNFPYIWHFNTYIASGFKLFLAVIIVSMMANEYSYGTLKQNLIDGLSKKEFITSKFLTVLVFASVSSLFVFVVSLLLGLAFSSMNELAVIFMRMEYIPAYFLKLAGFFSMCLFAGILVKRSAFSLGFIILWYIVEKLSWLLIWYLSNNRELASKAISVLPLESMSNLIKEPWTKLSVVRKAGNTLGIDDFGNSDVSIIAALIVCFWIAFFVYFSYKILEKRDL
ncbi:ABC transporter permease [Flavobacterium selenitireducens]|uniref:ABC transporter permease n=1 Tax=Flavobacterium selenitireducens TaxID=2722704 RepID=UPI00168B77E7|nr:ABC transporter permease [Flavobacterium selenitireducens]MBD3582593.1 ABC transporter permease subunit [Flavobacterium selenitireducens]